MIILNSLLELSLVLRDGRLNFAYTLLVLSHFILDLIPVQQNDVLQFLSLGDRLVHDFRTLIFNTVLDFIYLAKPLAHVFSVELGLNE